MPTTVTVIRDGGVRARGYRDGDTIVYDWGFNWRGVDHEQRSFILLDTGFQINQRPDFPPRAIAALADLPFAPQWELLDK